MPPKGPEGSNYKELRSLFSNPLPQAKPVVLKSFEGFNGGGFPPDPILAVGPNHVIAVQNTTLRIWDKDGGLLKSISGGTWFANVTSNYAGDPQVLYDQFSQRWITLGFTGSTPNHLLISVSDDDNPIGTWYNWSLPEMLGDSVTGAFADYPQMGYDENAIYITTREFGNDFFYSRVRIIPKADVYANTGGAVTWSDFWDFREPDHPFAVLDGIRPSAMFTPAGVHFLVNASPYSLGTFFTVWTIHDPIGTPSITGANIPVVLYQSVPQAFASQPGPAGNLIEVGTSAIRHKAVYRDSSLWMVHPIRSGTGNAFSALHYVRVNPFTNTNLEDVAAGLEGYWYYYPALMVDAEENVIITCTRSGLTEYPSAYVAGHKSTDPPGLSEDVLLKSGLGQWDPFVLGARNRWGDYMGIGLDPVDTAAIWVHTQYTSGTDAYKTEVAMTKMAPVPGKYIFVKESSLTFDEVEVGLTGDTLTFTVTNNGTDSLTISAIDLPDSHFVLLNPPTLPLKVGTFEVVNFDILAVPEAEGPVSASIVLTSDDALSSTSTVELFGKGFVINAAQPGVLYASSGTTDGGKLRTVDPSSAATTSVGPSDYRQLVNIRVNPATNELMGIATTSSTNAASYDLVRVNSVLGDAHPVSSIAFSFLKGMAFRGDTLYVARINGALYRVDIATGATTLVASTGLQISGIDFHPVTGELWASVRGGTNPDRIYKISLPSGVPTLVGATGFGVQTVDIMFDANGNLFGLVGTGNTTNNLILIDTSTGVAGLIGSMGIVTAQGLATKPGTGFNAAMYSFAPRWNMVSVPFVVPDYRKTVIFPTATSNAYEYVVGYQKRDTLDNNAGYWLKFASQSYRGFLGDPIPNDTMTVHAKWNMIGSRSQEVPVGMIASNPPGNILTSYFEYGDSGYDVATSVKPGIGYWVKAAADGQIVFNTLAAFSKVPKPSAIREYLSSFNSLLFSDETGLGQRLFIGKEKETAIDREQFDLPPAPPQGVFSARFASQQILESIPEGIKEAVDVPVTVSSVTSPMKVKWDMNTDPSLRYTLVVTSKGSPAVSTYAMDGAGEIVLRQPSVNGIVVRASMHTVPSQFVLHQNYPNPFNPQTMIRYELPVNELVTLRVYDILGREVATVVNQRQEAGYYSIPFSAEQLSSGAYFYQLTAGAFSQIQKMMLIR
jgi:hypothetical protein